MGGGELQNGRGGSEFFTITKRVGGKSFSHAEGGGTQLFGVVFTW